MFKPLVNDSCEICGLTFRLELLKYVRTIDYIAFVCPDCFNRILLIDGCGRMTFSEIKRVLDV